MKPCAPKRRETTSAAITPTLWLVMGISLLFAATAFATDPSWWSNPGTGLQSAVVAEQVMTNDGVVMTNYVANSNAVVVQGQLKQFTARAVDEMNATLPDGAGSNLNNLVAGWAQDYATNNYASLTNAYAPYNPRDFTAMTAGQLKYIGNMVWSQLVAEGYTNAMPAWLATNSADSQLAVTGQLKTLFNFDLSGFQNTVTGLNATLNGDGSVTLTWLLPLGSDGNTITIAGISANGTITVLDVVSDISTSDTLTAAQLSGLASLGVSNASLGLDASLDGGDIDNPIPSTPSGLTGFLDNTDSMNLSWTASTGAAGYVVERETLATGVWSTLSTNVTSMSYADTNHGYGGGYHYRVSAFSTGGSSSPSGEFPQSRFAVIDLGTNNTPNFMNDNGQVVMNAVDYNINTLGQSYPNPVLWDQGATTDIVDPSGNYGFSPGPVQVLESLGAAGINNNGVVTGSCAANDFDAFGSFSAASAFTWTKTGGLTALTGGPLPENPDTDEFFQYIIDQSGAGINDSGEVVGTETDTSLVYPDGEYNLPSFYYGGAGAGVYWTPGNSSTPIGPTIVGWDNLYDDSAAPGPVVTQFYPQSINQNGIIIGSSYSVPVYIDSQTNNVTTLYYEEPDGTDVIWPSGTRTGAVYDGTNIITLPGTPVAINNNNQVVGNDTNGHMVMWDGNNSYLPTVIPGGTNNAPTIDVPVGINARTSTSGTNTVSAAQILSNTKLWEMDPDTGTFGLPLCVSDLLPSGAGWGGVGAFAINGGGAIAGTANKLLFNTDGTPELDSNGNQMYETHGVLLLPFEIDHEVTLGSGVYNAISTLPIFQPNDGVGRGAPLPTDNPGISLAATQDPTGSIISLSGTITTPVGSFTGTLTASQTNPLAFSDANELVTVTLPSGLTLSDSMVDSFRINVTSSSLGLSNTPFTLMETAISSNIFVMPIYSCNFALNSQANTATLTVVSLATDSAGLPDYLEQSFTLSQNSPSLYKSVGSGVSLSITSTQNNNGITSETAILSGGSLPPQGVPITLTQTSDNSSVFFYGPNANPGANVTPDDPSVSGDGTFYIRLKGLSGSLSAALSSTVSNVATTFSPDPNDPQVLRSDLFLLVPQGLNNSFGSLKVLQVPSLSAQFAPSISLSMNTSVGTAVAATVPAKPGLYVTVGVTPTDPNLLNDKAAVGHYPTHYPSMVKLFDNDTIHLTADDDGHQEMTLARMKEAVPIHSAWYSFCHGYLNDNGQFTSVQTYDLKEVTPKTIQTWIGNAKYSFVFLNGCASADGGPGSHAMSKAWNCDAYIGNTARLSMLRCMQLGENFAGGPGPLTTKATLQQYIDLCNSESPADPDPIDHDTGVMAALEGKTILLSKLGF